MPTEATWCAAALRISRRGSYTHHQPFTKSAQPHLAQIGAVPCCPNIPGGAAVAVVASGATLLHSSLNAGCLNIQNIIGSIHEAGSRVAKHIRRTQAFACTKQRGGGAPGGGGSQERRSTVGRRTPPGLFAASIALSCQSQQGCLGQGFTNRMPAGRVHDAVFNPSNVHVGRVRPTAVSFLPVITRTCAIQRREPLHAMQAPQPHRRKPSAATCRACRRPAAAPQC